MDETSELPRYDRHEGDGPTLVLLHYWGGSARTWDLFTARLPGRDLLAIEARGWSRSAGLEGPYDLHHLADDVLDVLTDAGVCDFVLVGHSMGGKVAQLVAARHPKGLRAVVLVASGPALAPPEITKDYQAQLARAYDSKESVAAARDTILTAAAAAAAALPAEAAAQVVLDSLASAPGARSEWPLRGIAEDIVAETRSIAVPVLVVAGDNDQVEPVEVQRDFLFGYLADATLLVLPETGHLIPLEAAGPLAAAVSTFVSAVVDTPSVI